MSLADRFREIYENLDPPRKQTAAVMLEALKRTQHAETESEKNEDKSIGNGETENESTPC